jgi:hypothetical protein
LFSLDGHLRMPEHLRNVSNISFTCTLFFILLIIMYPSLNVVPFVTQDI